MAEPDTLSHNDFLWAEVTRLRAEVQALSVKLLWHTDQSQELAEAQGQLQTLGQQNAALRRQLDEVRAEVHARASDASKSAASVPVWVKPAKAIGPRRKPGRKAGHPAAVRPMPQQIDTHYQVPLGTDRFGKSCCPDCSTQLNDVKAHQRVVEEIIPSRATVICYHSHSGWCPCCRKTVESRAPRQPPAPPGVSLPQGQLGVDALVTVAAMRVCYRMPVRQITQLFHDLPGLKLSPGAVSRQIQRMAKWLEGLYQQLQLSLRASGVVYADETSWRTDGNNAQLWTLTSDRHTLYHVDKSRGGKVIEELLGKDFNRDGKSTLVSDFYSVYDRFDGPQQKCLAHLLREFKQTAEANPSLKDHPLFTRSRRLLKEMLLLAKRRDELEPAEYQKQVMELERRLEHLADPPAEPDPPEPPGLPEHPDVKRLRKRLAKYRSKLTTFLHRPDVNATNNAAERALRPAVVMRKITGGSRSDKGARAWAVLASVIRTIRQQGKPVDATLRMLLMSHWAGQQSDELK